MGILAGLTWAMLVARAESVGLDPASFKAAILSKIPPYIDWPKDAAPASDKDIVIGTLGEVPFQSLLAELLKNTTVNGRKVVVSAVKTAEEIGKCQILFIPAADTPRWQELRKTINTHGLLTVTDVEKFAPDSGVIFNLLVEKRVLEISVKNAREAGLSINSQLLRMAKIVK